MNNLRLLVLDNIEELGKNVNKDLKKMNKVQSDYIVPMERVRFSNGEGKVSIEGTVRDKDIYILSDVGNYNISYEMHGIRHVLGPDEHFQDIKRVISAISGYASKITVIMPLLYSSRQHRRRGRESLDCAIALQELERLGVDHIVTFDVHDPNVGNSVPNLPFENFFAAHEILNEFIETEKIENIEHALVVSPDMGAMERARYLAEMLKCDVGVFYKRRDLSVVVNGKNPIIEHAYLGADVQGKNIIVVDDIIASGSSILEVAGNLKERGAKKVYLVATFSLFTDGIEVFEKAYEDGLFDKLYTTNLTYVPMDIQKKKWFQIVDMSNKISRIINAMHKQVSLKPLFGGKEEILMKIEEKREKSKKKKSTKKR